MRYNKSLTNCTFFRSPSKIKKIKPFKFPIKKEKHEKLKDKDFKEIQKEKKKDGEKEKKKDKPKSKLKDKKKQKGSDGKSTVDIGALYGNFIFYFRLMLVLTIRVFF